MADITVNLRADPTAFDAGVKQAEQAIDEWEASSGDSAEVVARKLEEVIRAVVKLGTQSGKTKDDMVRDLRNFGLSAEDAERAVHAVWDEMGEGQRAAREVEKAATAYEEVEEKADGAADAAKAVGDESEKTGTKVESLGDIAKSVLEGDFGGAAESAIGALSALGLFAGAGGALAAAIGEGISGIVGNWVESWDDAAKESEQRVSRMFDAMLESGNKYLQADFISKEVARLADDTDSWNEAQKRAQDTGLEIGTVLRAMAGDQSAISATQDELNRKRQEELDLIDRSSKAGEERAAAIDAVNLEYAETTDWLRQIQADTDTAAEKTKAVQGAVEQVTRKEAESAQRGKDAIAERGKALEEYYKKAASPPEVRVPVTADTSAVDRELEALRRRAASIDLTVTVNQRRGTQVI
ncbi:hypothetical protein [Agromyces larvae]|uniref:Tape measure protein n=1 Tax=Agromyces larvae TaxID=2929802 RepID=A0ABY4BWZ7_9MICO|nr:hypothetical protein [Agromyces larvae]UOE43746.1 hypothetical protein MTO99_16480 [Agromyces larvae]